MAKFAYLCIPYIAILLLNGIAYGVSIGIPTGPVSSKPCEKRDRATALRPADLPRKILEALQKKAREDRSFTVPPGNIPVKRIWLYNEKPSQVFPVNYAVKGHFSRKVRDHWRFVLADDTAIWNNAKLNTRGKGLETLVSRQRKFTNKQALYVVIWNQAGEEKELTAIQEWPLPTGQVDQHQYCAKYLLDDGGHRRKDQTDLQFSISWELLYP